MRARRPDVPGSTASPGKKWFTGEPATPIGTRVGAVHETPSGERIAAISSVNTEMAPKTEKTTTRSPFGRTTGWTPLTTAVGLLTLTPTGADQVRPPLRELRVSMRWLVTFR